MSSWKNKKRKHKVRSDAKYNTHTAAVVCRLVAAGLTYEDIGYAIGVSSHTIESWVNRYPVFKKQIEKAREAVNAITLAQLLRAAWGYDYEEVSETYETVKGMAISMKDGISAVETPEPKLKKTVVHKKHQPPNGDLLKFILLNRDKENWKDVKQIDFKTTSSISLIGEAEGDAISVLAGKLIEKKKDGNKIPGTVFVSDTENLGTEHRVPKESA